MRVRIKPATSKILIVLLYFLGGYLLVACLQAGLGAIATNMREGPQYAAIFTLPMVAPLWLSSVFVETPNGDLAVILGLIPITAPLTMVQRIAITTVPWWQLGLSLVLLALGAVLTLWLVAKIFRVQSRDFNLLAGFDLANGRLTCRHVAIEQDVPESRKVQSDRQVFFGTVDDGQNSQIIPDFQGNTTASWFPGLAFEDQAGSRFCRLR